MSVVSLLTTINIVVVWRPREPLLAYVAIAREARRKADAQAAAAAWQKHDAELAEARAGQDREPEAP